MSYQLLLTIDVEDWFQVENFKQWIPFSSWSSHELRVEKNTHRLLDLFDSIEFCNSKKADSSTNSKKIDHMTEAQRQRRLDVSQFHQETGKKEESLPREIRRPFNRGSQSCISCLKKRETPKATFFILGWIAQRLPHLVREIHARGHEVASHGYNHNLCTQCSTEELRKDLKDSKKLLEDIIGDPVYGYRSPSFSIDDETLKTIKDCGYLYDSSFNSFGMHGRYGEMDLPKNGKNGIATNISNTFYELPISNLRLGKHVLPWGGGGYFRLIPLPLFKLGVQWILEKEKAYLLYLHSWELDPDQPIRRPGSRRAGLHSI